MLQIKSFLNTSFLLKTVILIYLIQIQIKMENIIYLANISKIGVFKQQKLSLNVFTTKEIINFHAVI